MGTYFRLTWRICSPKPGMTLCATASVASGVTSRGAGPVPPVVSTRWQPSTSTSSISVRSITGCSSGMSRCDHAPRRLQRGGEPFGESRQSLVLVDAGRRAVGDRDEADQQRASALMVIADDGCRLRDRCAASGHRCSRGRARGSDAAGRRARARRAHRARATRAPPRSAAGCSATKRVERVVVAQQRPRASARRRRTRRWSDGTPGAQRSSAARTGSGSMSRISLPMYCICRRRAFVGADGPRARAIASTRRSGKLELGEPRAGRARPAPRPGPAARASRALRRVFDGLGLRAGRRRFVGSSAWSWRVERAARRCGAGSFAMITDRLSRARRAARAAASRYRLSSDRTHDRTPLPAPTPPRPRRARAATFRSRPPSSSASPRAVLDAAQARRRDRRRNRGLARHRPKRDRAPGRGRDHLVQPRQGHQRHRLRRPAARPREHRRFRRRRDSRHRRQGARDRALHGGGPGGGPRRSGSARARAGPTSTSITRGTLSVEEAIELGREAEARGARGRQAHHQQRRRDGRAQRIGIRLRQLARLRRRLSHVAPSHRLLGDRRATTARCSAITGTRPRARRRTSTPARDVGRIAGERTVRRLGARKLAHARVPGAVRGARSGRPDRLLRAGGVRRQPLSQVVVPARLARHSRCSRRTCASARSRTCCARAAARRSTAKASRPRRATSCATASCRATSSAAYSARKLGMAIDRQRAAAATTSCSRTATTTCRRCCARMGRGLLVTEQLGQGVNPVTGDFSRGAAGFWVEDGEIAYPVEEITIAGNLQRHVPRHRRRSAATSTAAARATSARSWSAA